MSEEAFPTPPFSSGIQRKNRPSIGIESASIDMGNTERGYTAFVNNKGITLTPDNEDEEPFFLSHKKFDALIMEQAVEDSIESARIYATEIAPFFARQGDVFEQAEEEEEEEVVIVKKEGRNEDNNTNGKSQTATSSSPSTSSDDPNSFDLMKAIRAGTKLKARSLALNSGYSSSSDSSSDSESSDVLSECDEMLASSSHHERLSLGEFDVTKDSRIFGSLRDYSNEIDVDIEELDRWIEHDLLTTNQSDVMDIVGAYDKTSRTNSYLLCSNFAEKVFFLRSFRENLKNPSDSSTPEVIDAGKIYLTPYTIIYRKNQLHYEQLIFAWKQFASSDLQFFMTPDNTRVDPEISFPSISALMNAIDNDETHLNSIQRLPPHIPLNGFDLLNERNQNQLYCSICYNHNDWYEMWFCSGFQITESDDQYSEHAFCKYCMARHIESSLSQNNSGACECPYCCAEVSGFDVEKVILGHNEHKANFNKSILDRWRSVQKRKELRIHPSVCPGCSCENMACEEYPDIMCSRCMKEYCFIHGDDHPKMDCAAAAASSGKNGKKIKYKENLGRRIINRAWKFANTKSCPKCNANIKKAGGCNHISCSFCSHDFCWICKSNWTSNHYSCRRWTRLILRRRPEEEPNDIQVDLEHDLGLELRFDEIERMIAMDQNNDDTVVRRDSSSSFISDSSSNSSIGGGGGIGIRRPSVGSMDSSSSSSSSSSEG